MTTFLTPDNADHEFRGKFPHTQELINEALTILHRLGIPFAGLSPRRLERMALAFLAVARVDRPGDWNIAADALTPWALRTREIITYINEHFGEEISQGSYDDIRRKDLLLPVLDGVVVQSAPDASRNSPRRGYALSPDYAPIIRQFGTPGWDAIVNVFLAGKPTLAERLAGVRQLGRIPAILPSGVTLDFSPGEHNELQKAIIEEFLPRYGYGAEVLYVGDTAKKLLVLEQEKLAALRFFEIAHGELPDIIAYSAERNWLYLIEAVHSSGPISQTRLLTLEQLTRDCTADIIYVTAFLTRDTFRRFIADIAWETEVWIADAPDHLIHFNGEKFLGPYERPEHS
jgi:type II restriction enzyme